MTVYGFKKNKCKEEVYTKDEVYAKEEVYTKDELYTKNEIIALLLATKPVGSIEINTSGKNPSTYIGGTWIAWGSGKVPVGIDTSDTNFNTVEKTGGAKTHTHTQGDTGKATGNTGSTTLTTSQIPSHKHTLLGYNSFGKDSGYSIAAVDLASNGTTGGTRALSCDTASDIKAAMGNAGGGEGHTHTLNSHTHTNPTTNSSSSL